MLFLAPTGLKSDHTPTTLHSALDSMTAAVTCGPVHCIWRRGSGVRTSVLGW